MNFSEMHIRRSLPARKISRALALAAFLLLPSCGGSGSGTDSSGGKRIEISIDGTPVLGSDGARVTIVEFVDIQCPYCSVSARRMKKLVEARNGDVRLSFRHFPITAIHPRALPAALAAHCAGEQGSFWEMLDLLVAADADLSDESIAAYAAALDLDTERFDACLASDAAEKRIGDDKLLGQEIGIRATPTIYINGLKVVGLQSFASLNSLVDAELSGALSDEEN